MRCLSNRTDLFLAAALSTACVLGIAENAEAQRPVLEGAASTGTGASFGPGNAETVVLMTPMYVDVDIIYFNDERPKLEYVVGFTAELQGRVSVGVVPQLRFTTAQRPLLLYGLIGVPLVFAPFVLFGVEVGAGLLWRINETFGLFGEVVVDLFFLGNDIPDDSMLAKLDGNLGVRISF
jgi:hypothetical protein